jgi:hypothetical protein
MRTGFTLLFLTVGREGSCLVAVGIWRWRGEPVNEARLASYVAARYDARKGLDE